MEIRNPSVRQLPDISPSKGSMKFNMKLQNNFELISDNLRTLRGFQFVSIRENSWFNK